MDIKAIYLQVKTTVLKLRYVSKVLGVIKGLHQNNNNNNNIYIYIYYDEFRNNMRYNKHTI